MLLNEFFGKSIKTTNLVDNNSDSSVKLDDLFWYIVDHNKLHKDYFFPIAKQIKKLKEITPEMIIELYMPMVKKGCKEYYESNKMQGKLGKLFTKEMREELCHRLHDHFYDDVTKGQYKLGE
jgi:predicted transcriptional regulator